MKTPIEFLAKCIDLNTESLAYEQSIEVERNYLKDQLRECWRQAQAEQRKEFSSSYVSKKFETWYEEFKTEDYENRVI